jgi:hypothetical protein
MALISPSIAHSSHNKQYNYAIMARLAGGSTAALNVMLHCGKSVAGGENRQAEASERRISWAGRTRRSSP